MDEPLVDVKELTKRYGQPPSWWYVQALTGIVPSYKLGKYVKFRVSEVEAWIQTQRKQPPTAGTNGIPCVPQPRGRVTAR